MITLGTRLVDRKTGKRWLVVEEGDHIDTVEISDGLHRSRRSYSLRNEAGESHIIYDTEVGPTSTYMIEEPGEDEGLLDDEE